MAIMTGRNLLESIIESTGVEINGLIFGTLSARLQQMIDNNTYSKLAAGIAMSGFSTQINTATDINGLNDAVGINAGLIRGAGEGTVDQIEFPPIDGGTFTPINIDTGTPQTPVVFDAGIGSLDFMDDAAILTHVVINNFTSDDRITISNAQITSYSFANEGTDVDITFNFNDSGLMNHITLTGVVSSSILVFDKETFDAALGFDAFA